jgi:hypothetical protein
MILPVTNHKWNNKLSDEIKSEIKEIVKKYTSEQAQISYKQKVRILFYLQN